jgi:hypothetical protein
LSESTVDIIQGAKKGGGATEAANTLRSQQTARVLFVVSEGPCVGLVNGLKSVHLDKVAVVSQQGKVNYDGVSMAWQPGTQWQSSIDGFDAIEREVVVGQQVDQPTPVVRTITDGQFDSVRVTLVIPQLTQQDPKTGSVGGSSFEWAIDVQSNGTGYVQRYSDTIHGKNTSPYARAVKVVLDGSPPWDIRVRRVSADPADSSTVNRFLWSSFTEITSLKLRYPNTATLGLALKAHPFSSVPEVVLDWMGMEFLVPSNYDPLVRTYAGPWDGTFKSAWTNNPAWVWYGLVTHPRWGLGERINPQLLNKWQLYRIAQYCDSGVPDGRGGTEPRFVINAQIAQQADALQLLREVAAVFRGLVFWANAGVEVSQDAPDDAQLIYTPANVINGDFNYLDVSEKTKHAVYVCWWSDQTQFGAEVPEALFDHELVPRYGTDPLTLRLLGVTSRGMAARACKWARYSEHTEDGLVTFEVGAEGMLASPGRVFKINDPSEAGEQLGGRVHSAELDRVVLDRDIVPMAGEAYSLTVQQIDPSDATKVRLVTRNVAGFGVGTRTVIVYEPFEHAPLAETMWLLESTAVSATTWRCLAVEQINEPGALARYRITGLAHNPSKFGFIERGLSLDARPISRVSVRPRAPAGLVATESTYVEGEIQRARVTVSWSGLVRGMRFGLQWRVGQGPWRERPITSANTVDVDDVPTGTMDIEVRAVNSLGLRSPPSTASLFVNGAGSVAIPLTGANLLSNTEFLGRSITPAALGAVYQMGPIQYFGTEQARAAPNTSPWVPPGVDALVLSEFGPGSAGAQSYADVQLEGGGDAGLMPAYPGARMEFSAWMQAHRCRVALVVYFYDEAKMLMSGPVNTGPLDVTYGPGVNPTVDNSFTRRGLFFEVPSAARFLQPCFRKLTTNAALGPDSYAWILRPYLGFSGRGQREFAPYSPGHRQVPGSVVTEHVGANAVSNEWFGAHNDLVEVTFANIFAGSVPLLTFTPVQSGTLRAHFQTEAEASTVVGNPDVQNISMYVLGATSVTGERIVPDGGWKSYTREYRIEVTRGQSVTLGLALKLPSIAPAMIRARNTSVSVFQLKR